MKSMSIIAACGIALALAVPAAFAQAQAASASHRDTAALKKIDTKIGSGKPVAAGDNVTVHYTGWLYSLKADRQHGAEFDSSVGGTPFTFRVGEGKVIPGWDQGLIGMKAGGKRTLIIPASLGYGARGAGPIPPNANLIFDIELLSIK